MRARWLAPLLLLIFAVAVVGVRAYEKTPYCHEEYIRNDYHDTYWVSPFITNGNGKTHICAHVHKDKDDVFWGVEIPLDKHITLYYNTYTRQQSVDIVNQHCRRWF